MLQKFDIFKNGWESQDTICGWGSRLEHTLEIRESLPILFKLIKQAKDVENRLRVNDAGCGDLWWIKELSPTLIQSIDYQGYDIFERPAWNKYKDTLPCKILNICEEKMRPCHLIICRDVFIHWPNKYILKALEKMRQSSNYLLSTTFLGEGILFHNGSRINDFSMKHSKLDLSRPPFNLRPASFYIRENYNENCCQKLSVLWEL